MVVLPGVAQREALFQGKETELGWSFLDRIIHKISLKSIY